MIMDTQSVIDSKAISTANPFEDQITEHSSALSAPAQMPVEVRRVEIQSSSIDKGAHPWADQQQDTPPLYVHPENGSSVAASMTVVGANPPPPHQPVSENEWHDTLRELQNNLSALNLARRVDTVRRSRSRRFVKSLFNSQSFKKGSPGPKFGESDIERQERAQRIRVLEELVLGGMRKLARIHPEPAARTEWHLRSEEFAATIRKGDSVGNMQEFIANEKRKETILEGLAKGLTLFFMTPLAMTGVVIFGTGAMVYGLGKCIVTLGHVMTFGKFH